MPPETPPSAAAIDALRRAARRAPHDPALQLQLAHAYAAAGQFDRAADACRRAADLAPTLPAAHANLGVCLAKLGRHADAVPAFRRSLDLSAGRDAATLLNLALSLKSLGHLDHALDACDRAVAAAPTFAKAHEYRGLTLAALQRHADAVDAYRHALRLQPDNPTAFNNLGVSLRQLADYPAALDAFERALALAPDYPDAHNNLATTRLDAGRPPAEALPHYDRALELAPDRADVRHQRALCLLSAGEYARAWPEYESRLALPNWSHLAPVLAQHTRWDGAPAPDRTLCVLAEQAFGDALMLARYLPLAASRVGRLIVQTPPPLLRLLPSSFPDITFVPADEPLPPFDLACPLASLPLTFQTTPDTVPSSFPYLTPPPDLLAHWRDRIASHLATSNVQHATAIVWSGSRTDPHRTIPLPTLDPLLSLPNTHFFAFQKDPPDEDALRFTSLRFTSLSPDLHDFADTAAALAHMHLVITIDTATAHLAGALARPTHVLLRHAPDWRWSLAHHSTPWYPTLRLHRQPTPNDWPGAVATLLRALDDPD